MDNCSLLSTTKIRSNESYPEALFMLRIDLTNGFNFFVHIDRNEKPRSYQTMFEKITGKNANKNLFTITIASILK